MSRKTDNASRPEPSIPEHLYRELHPAGRQELLSVWEKTGHLRRIRPGSQETERALERVHGKMKSRRLLPQRDRTSVPFRFLAVAALLLLAFGAFWFFTPRTVTAPYGETAMHLLADGSTVELNSGTRLTYGRLFGLAAREIQLEGEAYFDISSGRTPFRVHANGAIVEVTGTRFNVRSWSSDPGSETRITVSEGEVHFYPAPHPDKRVVVAAGSMSRWDARLDAPEPPTTVPRDRIRGWRDNALIFDETSLQVIFNELERKFDVSIELQESSIGQETLSTHYTRPEQVESILNDISTVKGLRYRRTVNGYVVFRNER